MFGARTVHSISDLRVHQHLVRASAALHIHRNTVVYRMNKIEQLTGRPLREHRTAMALYLACLADRLGGGDAR
ncbi:helix-turn-helix domain-containing protein [Streptomyces paradoxus]|uniref:helix-turn-helix domain-containing protein n=1 Tax=Streptomyces paradoxus TaxID=66375 RepID=UPI003700D682